MTYEELKKRATPRPWSTEGGDDKRTSVLETGGET